MKFKNKVTFVLSLPICLGAGSHHRFGIYLRSENVLYKVFGDRNLSLNLTVLPDISGTYELRANLYNHKTEALLFSVSFNDEITKDGKTYTINYPLRYRINGDGLRFTYVVSQSQLSKSYTGVLYPLGNVIVNALSYRNTPFTSENRFIKVEKDVVVTGESFSFANFNEYLSKRTDNSIDFSSIVFNYLHDYNFVYSEAEYHIKDYHNVYPNLSKDNDEVVLKMKCDNNNGEISLTLNEVLYVKNDTLEMSSNYIVGYTPTDKLYIPVGKQSLLEENDSYILIKEAGYSAIDIKLPLTYYFSKKILGLCVDSDYCIEGGIKE